MKPLDDAFCLAVIAKPPPLGKIEAISSGSRMMSRPDTTIAGRDSPTFPIIIIVVALDVIIVVVVVVVDVIVVQFNLKMMISLKI